MPGTVLGLPEWSHLSSQHAYRVEKDSPHSVNEETGWGWENNLPKLIHLKSDDSYVSVLIIILFFRWDNEGSIFLWFMKNKKHHKGISRTSLVAQWLRIRLPVQGTQGRALVREDPTCHGATKPVRHNYWACALEPASHNYWACMCRACAPQQEKPPPWEARALQQSSTRSPQLEKARAQQQRPNAAKNK